MRGCEDPWECMIKVRGMWSQSQLHFWIPRYDGEIFTCTLTLRYIFVFFHKGAFEGKSLVGTAYTIVGGQ